MNFLVSWLGFEQKIVAWLVYAVLFVYAVFALRRMKLSVPVSGYVVAVVILALLWLMQVEIVGGHLNGMSYHLLGVNLLVLMLGAPVAFLLASFCLMSLALVYGGVVGLSAFPVNALLIIMPACMVNVLLRQLALRYLPKQVFIYIFINGFISGAIGMLLTGALIACLLQVQGVFSGSVVWGSAFPVFFLLSWGEAFLSGIGAAIGVAFKPTLLMTFQDDVYLRQQNQIWK